MEVYSNVCWINKCLAGCLGHCLGQWFYIKPAWSSLRWLINRVIPGSSLPSCDVVGQRKGAGIHILTTVLVGLGVGALWVSHTGERNCSGAYGISEVWGKSFSKSGSFPLPSMPMDPPRWLPPSPAVAMIISPAFSILTTAMSTLLKIIFLLFLLSHLITTWLITPLDLTLELYKFTKWPGCLVLISLV